MPNCFFDVIEKNLVWVVIFLKGAYDEHSCITTDMMQSFPCLCDVSRAVIGIFVNHCQVYLGYNLPCRTLDFGFSRGSNKDAKVGIVRVQKAIAFHQD